MNPNKIPLTKRELEIVRMLAMGYNSQTISDALKITMLTVYTHRRNILRRLELKSSAEVVAWAYRNQIV